MTQRFGPAWISFVFPSLCPRCLCGEKYGLAVRRRSYLAPDLNGIDSASSSAGQSREAADERSEHESPDQSANGAAQRGQADYA